ncbi:hypothetical protein LQ567_24285 [Niabella pedocola]|uniref:YD repeat-containing protein n=1 Tax=Niabella pedocola TaxID=1752077 RepID=A0ABS8PXY5_9BACT|nr:hypothetical protein [Niabella pedocola]MCD2425924.1 hypothetical protein [Niabella pedocola]
MRAKIVLFLQIFLIVNYFIAGGQQNNFTAVTPEAAALAKDVNYPVNYNSGLPDIRIPVYDINVGDLKLPVDLVYHAGGFRINEQATRAGLGWSLSSDLQITRTVNGKSDFAPGGYMNNSLVKTYYANPFTCPGCAYPDSYLENYFLATGERDAMPDKFNYKLLNKSGSFYFQKNDAGTGYSIVPVPYDNIWIQFNNGQFIITDSDGTKYYFGEPGASPDVSQFASMGLEFTENESGSERSSWKCKKIESAQGVTEFTFTYTAKVMAIYRNYIDYVEYYDSQKPCPAPFAKANEYPMDQTTNFDAIQVGLGDVATPKYMAVFGNGPKSYFHALYLDASDNVVDAVYEKTETANRGWQYVYGISVDEINFRGGKIKFNGADRLTSIQVLGPSNEEIKTIQLYQSYTAPVYVTESKLYNGLNFQGTAYLDSLHIKNTVNTYERYAFDYESKFCFGNHLKGQDAWGYRNGSTVEIAYANNTGGNIWTLPTIKVNEEKFFRDGNASCTNFATNIPVTVSGNNGAELPSEAMMKTGVLRRIVYPTGGFTDFGFEPNQYNEVFSWNAGSTVTETLPQFAGGLRIRSINAYDENGKHLEQKYYRYGRFEEGVGVAINKPSLANVNGAFRYEAAGFVQDVAYLQSNGTPQSSKTGLDIQHVEQKTTYQPASVLDYTYGRGRPVYYEKVTEYKQDLGKKTGKTVYEYYPPREFYDGVEVREYLEGAESRIPGTNFNRLRADWMIGAQKSIKQYKFNPAAKSYELGEQYKLVHKKEFSYTRYTLPQQVRVNYSFLHTLYSVSPGEYTGNPFALYSTSESFGNGWAFNLTDFIFGEYGIPVGRLLPSQVSELSYTDTDSSKAVTTFIYDHLPFLNPSKIQTTDSKMHTIEKQIKYAYNFSGTPVYNAMIGRNMVTMPVEEIEVDISAGGLETGRRKTEYNNFPVGLGVIAPASISSSVNGQPLQAVTRFQEYDQYGNALELIGKDGLPVSYLWGYQHLYPVAVLKGQRYAFIPSSYKSNVQIIDPSSDASLRALLSGLNQPGIMADLYTYRPMVGVTSHTAPDAKITYFEYDPIGRLVRKKDHDGNILNQYKYNVLNRSSMQATWNFSVNVPVMYSHNVAGSGFWYFYTKTVEGGKYVQDQSTADIFAQQDAETPSNTIVPDAPPSNNTADVAVVYLDDDNDGIDPSYYVDFIQNDAVVATVKCKSQIWDPPSAYTAHIPAGTYKISIRVGAYQRYDSGGLDFVVSTPSTVYQNFQNGDEINLVAGQHYEVMAGSFPTY